MDDEEDHEALGQQLYDLIYLRHAEIAGKLTGMLLELPGSVVAQMLEDEALLAKGLDRALGALQLTRDIDKMASEAEDGASVSSDSLGEQLYQLIDLYNTGHTQKLTGMLLEQKKEAALQLLSDPALLEENVNMAMKTLQERVQEEETDVSDSSDREEVESIGETLFALVQEIDPTHCADITGMLLEMNSGTLNQILSDRAMLEVAVQRAKSALDGILSQTHSN